jgi:hypothetical protein
VVGFAVEVIDRHRDDEARRAEAALAAVMVDHRALHRMQRAIGAGQPLDGAHGLAVKLRQEQDAGIERARAPRVADHHRAGAAIALVAAFLGAGQAALLAQPVEQRARRRRVRQRTGVPLRRNAISLMSVQPPPVRGSSGGPMRRGRPAP